MSAANAISTGPSSDAAFPLRRLQGVWLVVLTGALLLATFIEVLDSTVTNVAVPSLAGSLGVSHAQATWVISSYAVSAAIAVPLTGWLAGRIGEARLFMGAILLFTLTSMLCGLSRNIESLVTFRAMQGFCSGPMVPLSQTILLRVFPARQRTLALALWGMTVLLASIFGPVMGGWIVDRFAWPWIFFINLPIGVFAYFVCAALLPRDQPSAAGAPIDAIGIALLVVGVGALQAMFDLGRDRGWFDSHLIVLLAVVAVLALSALLIWESAEPHPVVDLTLFRDRTFTFGVAIVSAGMIVFAMIGVIFPLWMQTVMGYSALHTGMVTASLGILALVFSVLVGMYLERVDARLVASFGFLVFAAVLAWDAHFTLTMTFWQIVTPTFIQGIGLPCFFIPLTTVILANVPDHKLAAASGLSNFLRTMFAALGTALSVTWWDNRAGHHYGTLAQSVTQASDGTRHFVHALGEVGLQGNGGLAAIRQTVQQQAYMMATNDLFYMASLVCLALGAAMWLTRPRKGVAAQVAH